ncbi:multidrug resistance protein, putative [Vibrio cholerae]|uniref:multidrug efflux RND transporter permease subunit VexF n=1 Tax=Vibrio cholerae TaxID=666 RepID=UPI0011D9F9E0|nr:multidrug efflux RND transporter permease subunit VexF [Vibrio cholerae]TXY34207.1 multidrug efflux RND transporter permease subunit VexF [Vibrio cholerae]GHW84514.1 multidrug resistance protein, putative [Vibrio cholerae]
MFTLIDAALSRTRTMLTLLVFILVAGVATYLTIPKESSPDVTIPIIYVSVSHQGISPSDTERLIVRPLEQEMRSIEGVKEMTATASEGHASVVLEFNVGVDLAKAMADVRDAVDLAKPKLPADSDEPTVNEVTLAAEQPVLSVVLYGTVPERTAVLIARQLRDKLESFRQILSVDIAGDREEIVEIIVDPLLMESYGLDQSDIYNLIALNNRVVAAGFVDTGYGRFSVKVPSVFESLKDVLELPIKVEGKQVITFGDVATVRKSFRDPESFARLDGKPAIVLDIKKRSGENIIETVELVKAVLGEAQARDDWPNNLLVKTIWDESEDVKLMLNDLQNNILSAIILVVVVIIAILGVRTSLLVGVSIPGSFLTGLLVLAVFGLTVNIVVLFALIMAVGMLVDGAIVVTEFADRRMQEGMHRSEAYRDAAKRMAWPITASTATTLAAFAPLLFWPDVTGEFMKYLPLTLMATLTASLVMALLFVPVLGSLFGRPQKVTQANQARMVALHNGDFSQATGITKAYYHTLAIAIRHPIKILCGALLMSAAIAFAYGKAGLGAEFFPEVDPPFFSVKVRSYGDLSLNEKDRIMSDIEQVMLGHDEFESVYTRTGGDDEIGVVQITPVDWQYRRSVKAIIEELEQVTDTFPGVEIEYKFPDAGPPVEHDLEIEISARVADDLDKAAQQVRLWAEANPALTNLSDNGSKPGIDWKIDIRRDDASRFAADATLVGNTVQFVTNGLKIGDYLPDDSDEEVDILVRYPSEYRDIGRFDQLRVKTAQGLVPLTNFAQIIPEQKQDTIHRVDGRRVISVMADLKEGYNLALELPAIEQALRELNLPSSVEFRIRGQNEEQEHSAVFLEKAFMVALAAMAIILITQFNSFYQSFLILTAVIFSTVGVFAGLLIFQKPFGIIMSGIGVIALAGIVVNNNIVLIDTYNQLLKRGLSREEAILRTGVQRLRPVLLTTVTTILGLLPMVLEMNIDIINQKIEFGAPSTQWWSQLATAVAGGLAFATVLTLVLTPCLLMLGRRRKGVSEDEAPQDAQS